MALLKHLDSEEVSKPRHPLKKEKDKEMDDGQ